MSSSALLDSVGTPDPPGDRTLARLTEHVRALLPATAVLIATVDDRRRTVERCAGWFADPKLSAAVGPGGRHALDARGRAVLDAILARDKPLFLSRLGIWEKAESTIVFVTHSIPEAVFLSTRVVVMSPRPGRISETIEVDLPYPRNAMTHEEPRFFELVTAVREALAAGHGGRGTRDAAGTAEEP